ncbi:MAG: hypothetical protein WCI50_13845 [Actinomycetes bacterium]
MTIGDLTFRSVAERMVVEERDGRRRNAVLDVPTAAIESLEVARTRPTDGALRRLPFQRRRFGQARSQTGIVVRLRGGERRYFVVLGRPESVLTALRPLVEDVRRSGGSVLV